MTNSTGAGPAPTTAWIDPSNGVSGDMLLGALVDAGASLAAISAAVEAVIPGTVRLEASEVRRAGMRACKVDVVKIADDLPHRDWAVIRDLLQRASVDDAVRDAALRVFGALADAEARAHGIEVERVHFHEVGAWDSIADVVGVCAGLAELGLSEVLAGTVGVGSGTIRTAHGEIPVPVPAVLELSRGWSVVSGGAGELATPTGMALVAALARPSAVLPAGVVRAVGVGAGSRDDPHRPNVVRVVLLDRSAAAELAGVGRDEVELAQAVVIEANVDDLDPRLWPGVLEALLAAGAEDAWLTPMLMKKGRPAHTLGVLCPPARVEELRARVFALTPTLGVREHPVTKHMLPRLWREVEVGGSRVRIKIGHAGGVIVTATPEFADVVAAAASSGQPQREVLSAAIGAAAAAGLVPGADLGLDG